MMCRKAEKVKAYTSRILLASTISLALIISLFLPVLAMYSAVPLVSAGNSLPALASTAWPMFQHDQRHTGQSPYLGTQKNTVRWAYSTGSPIRGSAVIGADGTIYVNSYAYGYKLYAINPDGSIKWARDTDDCDGSPAISSDGTIYIAGTWGLYAYNPDGTRKWFCSATGLTGSPVIGDDGTIYCGMSGSGGAGSLYAFKDNGGHGSVKWTYGTGQTLQSAPAIGNGGTIYIGSVYNTLYALKDNGTAAVLKWSFAASSSLSSSPPSVGGDGTIYIGSDYGYVYAITDNGTNAVPKWRYDTGGSVISTPAIGNGGTIYVGCQYGPHMLFAINPNGSLKWDYNTSGDIASSSPALGSDGTIYIGDVSNRFYAISDNVSNAVVKWQYLAGDWILGSAAIGSDGTVYIGSYDTNLYAFNNHPYVNAPAAQSASVATSLGAVNFSLNAGSISGLTNIPASNMPCSAGGYIFPYGMFSYSITNLAPGQTVNVTIKLPSPIPLGSKMFKCQNGSLTGFTQYAQQPDPNTFILTLKDGGQGDADGVANGTIIDPCGPAFLFSNPPQSSSAQITTASQGPAVIASIAVQSASLSTDKVAPGAPVTVTADVANRGTADGSAQIKLYINGQEETHQGVTLSSGSRTPVKFTVSRDEPGTYSVYVGSVPAGTFEVDQFADPNIILYISGALLGLAFVLGLLYILRRRQPGH